MLLPTFAFPSILFGITIALSQSSKPQCKPYPGAPNWPSSSRWKLLNQTVSGRLLAPIPLGSVCHSTWPIYNNVSCAILTTEWTNLSFQESNPFTSMYNDDTCRLSPSSPCSTAGYPAYVIAAEDVSDVQAGINFARETGVRLVVKGTGHDSPGRSAGAGALSIWTHRLRGIQVSPLSLAINTSQEQEQDQSANPKPAATVKIGAGEVWGDIYAAMASKNLTVVGGADPHVGVGGWTQGGGHDPMTSYYGMGADQVLEMEVVTADGVYRIINSTSSPDLFWAIRGGGPGTWGVVLSMTVVAYPRLPGVEVRFMYGNLGSVAQYWDLVGSFSKRMPGVSDAGGMGYYYLVPYVDPATSQDNGLILGTFLFPTKTLDEVQTMMASLEKSLEHEAARPLNISGDTRSFENFMQFWHDTNELEAVGSDSRYASWLLDGSALARDRHLVAGMGVRDAQPVSGSNAIFHAWRNAYVHLLQSRSWTPLNVTEKDLETTAIRDKLQPALRSLAPDAGAYVNEADPSNPNWKRDYYGGNYERLLSIKNKWDPEGVFWYNPCVGYDEWDVVLATYVGISAHERWIGQDQIMLCKSKIDEL